jgi:PIN domain nuclease of toxin-antitoxin system
VKLLLDTHFVIEVVGDSEMGMSEPSLLEELQDSADFVVSVVSLWEAEIKSRMGKLRLQLGPQAWPDLLETMRIDLIPIETRHVFADIGEEIGHRDPFDRVLLSSAAAEGCKLLTRDRLLLRHPLAWRPFLP